MNIYLSIYRKKQYQDISFSLPLLSLYNEQYNSSNIKDVETKHEMMFCLMMVRKNKINYEDLWKLIKYYTKKYDNIEILLKCGVDINMRDYYFGHTALIIASREGHIEIVEKIISAGCKLNILNKYGNTALITASLWGHIETVKKLVSAGCGLDIQNRYGNTALISASYHRHHKIVGKLINARCGLNIQNNEGKTALDIAIKIKCQQIIDLLMAAKK